ncbi:acyltransferase family protein [Desertibacillus haloalkaliphilus]|uniref:acyltransferase family protein n=1 Tax=Desertibacillus haloalkaliphilus TaxID=1328930 RepID=UPI001C278A49|nr:acyltransferase family protein [Desertibacillus haloalkaliphilus]MBU8906422.1 acyltransferase family protein [Desertibacillus haloalkaliphilus]
MKEIKEVYWLRIFACCSVVLIHALSKTIADFSLTGDMRVAYRTLQMILLYGTPMFVLISTIIMTHAYKDKVPKGFLMKRVKYILIPYTIMATFYAGDKFVRYDWSFSDFARELGYNFIGQWHGYFVLIIFQFYLLHLLFVKYMKRFKAKYILTLSFIVSVGYWLVFYFYAIDYVNHSSYLTLFFSRILFVGWLFYYVVAYYCGRNYQRFNELLKNNWTFILLGTIVSLGIVQYIYHSGMLMRVTSARFDIIPYTVMLFFLFFFLVSHIKRTPKWVGFLSSYSFGIYLLHPFVQTVVSHMFSSTEAIELYYLIVQFIAGVLVPILLIYIISKVSFGELVIGKTMKRKKSIGESQKTTAA